MDGRTTLDFIMEDDFNISGIYEIKEEYFFSLWKQIPIFKETNIIQKQFSNYFLFYIQNGVLASGFWFMLAVESKNDKKVCPECIALRKYW